MDTLVATPDPDDRPAHTPDSLWQLDHPATTPPSSTVDLWAWAWTHSDVHIGPGGEG